MTTSARTADEKLQTRRMLRWGGVEKIANLLLDDDTIKVNNLDIHAAQINGLGDFMCYVQLDTTLQDERLVHLMKLAELYDFRVVVLSRHDGEGRYNLRLWANE